MAFVMQDEVSGGSTLVLDKKETEALMALLGKGDHRAPTNPIYQGMHEAGLKIDNSRWEMKNYERTRKIEVYELTKVW